MESHDPDTASGDPDVRPDSDRFYAVYPGCTVTSCARTHTRTLRLNQHRAVLVSTNADLPRPPYDASSYACGWRDRGRLAPRDRT